MLQLGCRRRRVTPAHRFSLHRCGIVADSVRPSAKCHVPRVRNGIASNDRLIHVGVANDAPVHAHHRRVICEVSAAPLAAHKTHAHVSMSVINSAVVPDAIAPVAIMEPVMPAVPSPPRRSPKRALVRRRHPLAGNPVVAIVAVGPVSRNPHPALLRTYRLLVYRQNWRSNGDADRYTRKRCCGNDQQHQHWQEPAHTSKQTHRESSLNSRLVVNKYAFSMTSQGWPKAIAESMGLDCAGMNKRRHRISPPGSAHLQPVRHFCPRHAKRISRGQTGRLEPLLPRSVVRRKEISQPEQRISRFAINQH